MKSKKSIIKDDLPKGVTWGNINKTLKNDKYQDQIQKLDTSKLKELVQDENYLKLLIFSEKAIREIQPEKLTEKYITQVENGMRRLAKQVIEDRSKSK